MNSDDLDDNDGENEYQAKIAGNPCKIHVSSCHFHCPLQLHLHSRLRLHLSFYA